jgi:hypothetical protein
MVERTEDNPKGRRKLIAEGEQANVYMYLDGMLKGNVGRVPIGDQDQVPTTEKGLLNRFRAHQIAYLMFPQYNINVLGLDLNDGEMLSTYVKRSIGNLRHATSRGVGMRHDKRGVEDKLPPEAEAAANEMSAAGVFVHDGLPNVSVTAGEARFFEIVAVDPALARKRLGSGKYPPATVERGRLLIDAYELETKLYESEAEDLIDSPRLRAQILSQHGKGHLAKFYEEEIGKAVIPWKKGQ